MKEISNSNRFSFANKFNSVNAGQRNVIAEPELVVCSTEGGFRITGPISKALGVEAGEYIMFVNNINEVDDMIRDKHPEFIAFCSENGLDPESPEAAVAVHKVADMWGICKGYKEFDSKGNPKTSIERLTKKDKAKFVNANFDVMLSAALEKAPEDVKAALLAADGDHDKQVDILIEFVQPRELPKFSGSKTANPAGLTGVGTTLNFTDSNVWSQLKADLGDKASTVNRVYTLDPKALQPAIMNNGYEDVEVKVLILSDYKDVAPARIGKKDEE